MKKSFTITINRSVFYIDDDAFQRLDTYLQSIKKHYGTSAEGQEILTDIEASIAEKFSRAIKSKQQSVSLANVEEVLGVLGTVEEFSQEAAVAAAPTANEEAAQPRRLFRNSDDTIIAGVCSGLATYFGIDAVYVRLAFILLTFVHGLGIFVYAILWLVMPRANTSGQKLAMQGEAVNIKKIENLVREKAQLVREGGREAMSALQQHRGWLYRVLNIPVVVLAYTWKGLKVTGQYSGPVLCVIIGVTIIIGMLASVLGLTIGAGVLLFYTASPYLVTDLPLDQIIASPFYYLGVVSSYIIALVPALFLLLGGFTLARLRNMFKPLASGLLIGIWMLAVTGAAVAAANLAPVVTGHLAALATQEQVTRTYDYEGFSKVYIDGEINVTVVPSTTTSVTAMGRAQDLDRLEFTLEQDELRVIQHSRQQLGIWCVACLSQPVALTVTGPRVDVWDARLVQ